jgi:hypothetical protein
MEILQVRIILTGVNRQFDLALPQIKGSIHSATAGMEESLSAKPAGIV